ncbi:MAG: PaaI family thioesterase [Candidatus Eremiobacteraeota bacterium]|nr:PaaI family thioesterase [Candidatus Eremiobacteraeota bacterium]
MKQIKLDRSAALEMFESQRHSFTATLDLHLIDVAYGEAIMVMPFRPAVQNGAGNVHGGAIMSLCDSVFWVALATVYGRAQPTATASLTCNFLRPARRPYDLRAHAKVLKAGKRVVYGTVDVFGEDDKMVAHATANFVNTPPEELPHTVRDGEAPYVRL